MSGLRIGMIGLDTSHCPAFAKLLHDEKDPHHVPGGRVVAAFPGGSAAFSLSRDRVAGFTKTLRDDCGVAIAGSIAELARNVDAFFLESVDGRQHLEQFRAIADCGKPVFIDKPLACSHADARAILDLARKRNVPLMTASAVRFARGIAGLCGPAAAVRSCEAFGPMSILPDYPPYFWYGIHSADVLFSCMGKGCREVRAVCGQDLDILIGAWQDGRIGTLRGTRFGGSFGCTVFNDKQTLFGLAEGEPPYYALLLQQVMPFFQTGKTPIDPEESVEIIGFLDAAQQSREQGGAAIRISV